MRIGLLAALGAAALLAGCAASQQQCQGTNWEQLGLNDGFKGSAAPSGESAMLLNTCGSAGVTPDRAAYERGRRQGLGQWCRSDWYSLGREDGLRGAVARDMGTASALCSPIGAGVDASGYVAGYRQGGEQYCDRIDWVGQGHKTALEGKHLDANTVNAVCRSLGVTANQRFAYEQGAARYCRTIDWRALGRKQAEANRPADAQSANPPACSLIGVRPDAYAFHAGYETVAAERASRLAQQCAVRVLFDAGRAGRPFDAACTSVGDSRRAHDGGRSYAQLDAERRALDTRRDTINRTGTVVEPGKPPQPLSPMQKSTELNQIQSKHGELTRRMDDLAREFR